MASGEGEGSTAATEPAESIHDEFVTIEASVSGRVGRLWLNRPDKLNPLGPDTLLELEQAARWFDTHAAVKVVVVGGRGRVFSAGADLSAFALGAKAVDPREAGDRGRRMADALEAMRAVAIARIQGWCVGGGLVLAAACDLRVAEAGARFSIPEVDIGIPLAWGGIPRLVREIGPTLTKELVMTCRPFDAAEAKDAGFLNRVVAGTEALDAEVETLVEQLVAKPSLALLSTKAHTNAVTRSMTGLSGSWADADGLLAGLRDPEGQAAAAAYLEQRR